MVMLMLLYISQVQILAVLVEENLTEKLEQLEPLDKETLVGPVDLTQPHLTAVVVAAQDLLVQMELPALVEMVDLDLTGIV
jgi:hypothetical protein